MRYAELLDGLRVVAPCQVPWAEMTGDDRVRSCDRCRKNVYNVAAMTRAEVVALLQGGEGRACLKLTRRPDGTLVTAGCWARLRQARRRGLLTFAVMLPVVLAAQLWAQAFGLRALVSLVSGRSARSANMLETRGGVRTFRVPERLNDVDTLDTDVTVGEWAPPVVDEH